MKNLLIFLLFPLLSFSQWELQSGKSDISTSELYAKNISNNLVLELRQFDDFTVITFNTFVDTIELTFCFNGNVEHSHKYIVSDTMLKNIVIPIDIDEDSLNEFKHATELIIMNGIGYKFDNSNLEYILKLLTNI